MGKPSIFSREYEKKMQHRKIRRRILLVLAVILLIFGAIFILSPKKSISFKSYIESIQKRFAEPKTNATNTKINNKQNKLSNKNSASAQSKKKELPKKNTEQNITVKLKDGKTINLICEAVNGKNNKFKTIEPADSSINYDISPSGKGIMIYESNTQTIYYSDLNGKLIDITKPEYISRKGNTYLKEDKLRDNPDYMWCASPKFIDDENIAYISQLPWLNIRDTKYIWTIKISDPNDQTYNSDLSGSNVKIGNLTSKGLQITLDDKVYYLKSDGSYAQ